MQFVLCTGLLSNMYRLEMAVQFHFFNKKVTTIIFDMNQQFFSMVSVTMLCPKK